MIMKTWNAVRYFIAKEDGPTAVEYSIMLAMIVLTCIGAIIATGREISATWDTVNGALGDSLDN